MGMKMGRGRGPPGLEQIGEGDPRPVDATARRPVVLVPNAREEGLELLIPCGKERDENERATRVARGERRPAAATNSRRERTLSRRASKKALVPKSSGISASRG